VAQAYRPIANTYIQTHIRRCELPGYVSSAFYNILSSVEVVYAHSRRHSRFFTY